MAEARFDFVDVVASQLVEKGIGAVNQTIDYAFDRARYHVPVRAIFKRSRRGPEFPRLLLKEDVTPAQAMTAYRRHPIATAAQYERFQRSQPRYRRLVVPSTAPGIATEIGKTSAIGHSNSEHPVIRYKRITVTGDFRQVSGGQLRPVPYATVKRTGNIDWWNNKVVVTAQPKSAIASIMTTARGRYEIRSGRANLERGDTGVMQVGGRLKRSIRALYASLSSRSGDTFMGYVSAGGGEYPDGTEVTFVARLQEYGSAHNRAHPFLRPALYESRTRFRANMRRALGGR